MHRFSVWAPYRTSVIVEVEGKRHAMQSEKRGWWHAIVGDADHGSDYTFLLDEDPQGYPDPRSAWQPYDVHKASRVFDHNRFNWTDCAFSPVALSDAIIYEIHIGTFTALGTFLAAEERLEEIRELGITHIELMPLHSFPGRFGWGYDGVALFAPPEVYGGPEALQHFVNACHSHQLAVLIDVVYNHFGPVGNYTGKFGPYTTENHNTPWGAAVNLEDSGSTEVRRFFCDNALMWLRDYHFDGLRIDAIQTFVDRSATHFLEQLSQEVDQLSTELNRSYVLIAESDLNDPRVVLPRFDHGGSPTFGYGIDAQWNDDFHHALFALLTGQRRSYYRDFGLLAKLVMSLASVFVFNGGYSEYRGRNHGRLVGDIDRNKFVGYIQNHDQIGNQPHGARIVAIAGMRKARLAAAVILTSPFVPMLFQGEEFAASSPFLYFAQHDDPGISRAVFDGRRREHEYDGSAETIPDPGADSSFEGSKLNWEERDRGEHAQMLDWYRSLIQLRRLTPSLRDGRPESTRVVFDESKGWLSLRRGSVDLYFNFGDSRISLEVSESSGVILTSDIDNKIQSGRVSLTGISFAAVSSAA